MITTKARKVFSAVLLSALLLFAICGCGSAKEDIKAGVAVGEIVHVPTNDKEPEDITGQIGEVMRTPKFDFAVQGCAAMQLSGVAPQALGMTLSITNTSGDTLTLKAEDFFLVYTLDGAIVQINPNDSEEALLFADGETRQFILYYNLPAALNNAELSYVGELSDEAGDIFLVELLF